MQNKPLFISIASAMGTVFFIIVVATTNHMVQCESNTFLLPPDTQLNADVFVILAFGCVYALCPLTRKSPTLPT